MRISSSPYSAYRQQVPATANYGLLSVGPGPWDGVSAGHFVGNPNGTGLAMNVPTGFAGDYINIQTRGSGPQFSVITNGTDIIFNANNTPWFRTINGNPSLFLYGVITTIGLASVIAPTNTLFIDAQENNTTASMPPLAIRLSSVQTSDAFTVYNPATAPIAGIDAIGRLYGLDIAFFAVKITASTTLTLTSPRYIWVDASAGAVTLGLPASTGNPMLTFTVKKIDSTANAVTIAAAGTDTIEGAASISLSAQWTFRAITNTQAGEWYITGGSTL